VLLLFPLLRSGGTGIKCPVFARYNRGALWKIRCLSSLSAHLSGKGARAFVDTHFLR